MPRARKWRKKFKKIMTYHSENDVKQSVWDHKLQKFVPIEHDDVKDTTKVTTYPPVTTYVKPACKHNGTSVLWAETDAEGQTREFVIADYNGCKACKADVALDLNRNLDDKLIIKAPDEYLVLNKWSQKAKVVQIDWPDYQALHAPLDFWLELLEILPKQGRILITCHGGHGRSGTALAAILVAKGMSPGQAMEYVRTMHCPKAVENAKQEDYLINLGVEAVLRGLSKEPVQDALKEIRRTDGTFLCCGWCGVEFKNPEAVDVCTLCWEDGYRADGQVDPNGKYLFRTISSTTSSYGYFDGFYDSI